MRERLDELPVEQKFGDQVNPDVNGVTDDAAEVQHLLSVGRVVDHHVKNRENAVEGGDGHREQEQNEQQREQPTEEPVFVRINRVFATSSRPPFVDQQHVPRRPHDASIGEDGRCHEGQHRKGQPCGREGAFDLDTVSENQQRDDHQKRQRDHATDQVGPNR